MKFLMKTFAGMTVNPKIIEQVVKEDFAGM